SIVVAGDRQPPWVHARIHAINEALGNVGKTVELGAPVAFDAGGDLASLHALASAMAAGKVDSLLIVGGNPVYDAPADLAFGDALARVAWKAHLSLYDDETSLRTPTARHRLPVPASPPGTGIELVFAADPTVGDGRHANNAWLQELPKPLTTLTWDNAALLSPALAERLQIANEDVIEIAVGGRSIKLPAWIVPGYADRSLTVYLGHGRSRAGTVGNGVGADAS